MVAWKYSNELVPYEEATAFMEDHVAKMAAGEADELIWLLEHPPLYTAGTSADPKDLVDPDRFEVHTTKRGGQYTYHGPGQRIIYVMLDLNKRGKDVRKFVCQLEDWVIETLAEFGVIAERRLGRVGVWVDRGNGREDKIAAIGVRLRKWVSFHGISINVEPDLTHYQGIVPCGIAQHGVTSLVDLGLLLSLQDLDLALKAKFDEIFSQAGED